MIRRKNDLKMNDIIFIRNNDLKIKKMKKSIIKNYYFIIFIIRNNGLKNNHFNEFF